MNKFVLALALTGAPLADSSWAETPLLLERKIPLGEVRGRIDHLAVDLKRNRLFVAELENDTVAVVDLDAYKLMHIISGLRKPQGLGYHPATDALYVANGGDGTVAVFRGDEYSAARMPIMCVLMRLAVESSWHTVGDWRSSIQAAAAKSPIST